jgi:ferredoxin
MSERLRLNPIACEAHGMCAELLPERIVLDEWGYPIVDERPLPPKLVSHAQRAAQACPTFALLSSATVNNQLFLAVNPPSRSVPGKC